MKYPTIFSRIELRRTCLSCKGFEVHIYPRRHVTDLAELSFSEQESLAHILKEVVLRYDSLLDFSLPYMMVLHQAPPKGDYRHIIFILSFILSTIPRRS
ncbi:MAG: hypothetical protein GX249_07830 [Firmicutes bacterium]|nr:hypothetical protein [Bacillota bacterium]